MAPMFYHARSEGLQAIRKGSGRLDGWMAGWRAPSMAGGLDGGHTAVT